MSPLIVLLSVVIRAALRTANPHQHMHGGSQAAKHQLDEYMRGEKAHKNYKLAMRGPTGVERYTFTFMEIYFSDFREVSSHFLSIIEISWR